MKGVGREKYMKISSMVLVFLFVFSWAGIPPLMSANELSAVTAEGPSIGDVDGEGAETVCDAILALQGIVGLVDIDGNTGARIDMNGDGAIDVSDAISILRRIANNQEPFPAEPGGRIDGASAQSTTMLIESTMAQVGNNVDVTFSVTDPIDIAGFSIKINYDRDSLEFVECQFHIEQGIMAINRIR